MTTTATKTGTEQLLEIFGLLGKANHYMDRDFYPTNESLKREELEFIFAGIEEVGQKLNKIITELEFSEVCNESIKCVLIRQGIML